MHERSGSDEERNPRGERADDEHEHVAEQQQQSGVEVELDVDAHDRHQAVRILVVGLEAARDT
jgi:hypothetical protein